MEGASARPAEPFDIRELLLRTSHDFLARSYIRPRRSGVVCLLILAVPLKIHITILQSRAFQVLNEMKLDTKAAKYHREPLQPGVSLESADIRHWQNKLLVAV
jgi:hypothetical protein